VGEVTTGVEEIVRELESELESAGHLGGSVG